MISDSVNSTTYTQVYNRVRELNVSLAMGLSITFVDLISQLYQVKFKWYNEKEDNNVCSREQIIL